jgi:1,4-alpha-glucan branching enzyme
VGDLNRLYRSEPALHERDFDPAGFEWIDCTDSENSVVCFLRRAKTSGDLILAACNFTPVPRHNYRVGAPRGGTWTEVLNSDARTYGGRGQGNQGGLEAAPVGAHGRKHSLNLVLPPLSAVFLKSEGASK